MATIGKVAAVFSASTSGLTAGVRDASRSFRQLGGDASSLGAAFAKLQNISGRGVGEVGPAAGIAAARLKVMQGLAERLQASLASGSISAEEFAGKMELIRSSAETLSGTLVRGAAVTEQFRTAQEIHAATTAELSQLMQAGAISGDTYARAMAAAGLELANQDGSAKRAAESAAAVAASQAKAQSELDAKMERGRSISEEVATAQEKHAATTRELMQLLGIGAISEEAFDRAVANAAATLSDATGETRAMAAAMDDLTALHREGASVTQSVATAEERHAATVANLDRLLRAGAIGQEAYNRAVSKSETEMAGAASGARKMASAIGTADNALSKINSKLNALITIQAAQLFGSIASAASNAVRSLIGMGQAESEVIDRTSKLADRLGMTYGELSGLSLAGQLAGVSLESIGKAATKGDIAFAKLAEGSAVAQAAFGLVGLTLDDLNGKTSAERFAAISDAIAALPTEAERARAAVSLFGKAGAELLPLFNEGSASVAETAKQAERLGIALTNEQSASVEAMNDSFDLAGATISGVIGQVTAYLAPALQSVSDTFVQLVGDVGGATIGQTIGDGILRGAEYLATIADAFIASGIELWNYASSVGADWTAIWDYAQRTAAFFAGVGDAFQAGVGFAMLGITGPMELILTGIKAAASLLGFESAALDAAVAGMNGFNQGIATGITDNIASASANFGKAFGDEQQKASAGAAGPIASGLRDAIAKAKADAAAPSTAKPVTLPGKEEKTFTGTSASELKATDSRSKEGISEMFRLMRGEKDDVPQKSLEMLTQIHMDLVDSQEFQMIEIGAN
jgi:hypothetical protein